MRTYQKKRVEFVKTLLKKPKWYNECITHPNWFLVKQAIRRQQPISMIYVPKIMQDNLDKLQELRNWQKSYEAFVLRPPLNIFGGVSA